MRGVAKGKLSWFPYPICWLFSICPSRSCPMSPESNVYGLYHPEHLLLCFLGGSANVRHQQEIPKWNQRSGVYSPVPFLPGTFGSSAVLSKGSWKVTPPVFWQLHLPLPGQAWVRWGCSLLSVLVLHHPFCFLNPVQASAQSPLTMPLVLWVYQTRIHSIPKRHSSPSIVSWKSVCFLHRTYNLKVDNFTTFSESKRAI